MELDFGLIDGQTPLDEEEKEGLLIGTITTRKELDEFEQLNIEQALRWIIGKKFKTEEILSEGFIRRLHRRMYGSVWGWAGEFRRSNKNIGVDRFEIPIALRSLLDDCRYWIQHQIYLPDELTIRFKHRLVEIHCFANGNGRHSRLMADIIIEHVFNQPIYSWGSQLDLSKSGKVRNLYIEAIKMADAGNLAPLIKFARQ
ncbi:MAG: mobile mystery protein B [Cyclobacteriaceae bacterium]|nr:mobile mystery protein B [Cyclobacteriaceae bacterium]